MNGIQHSELEPELQGSASGDGATRTQRVQRHLWQRVGRGILVLIPMLVTLLIVRYFIIAIAEGLFSPAVDLILDQSIVREIPGATPITWLVVLLLALVFFYLLGGLVTGSGGQNRVVSVQNAVLSRIPVVNRIYGVARQTTEALSASSRHEFSRVVFLEWPRPGVRAMGLVTGRCTLPDEDRALLIVYIATVPNPTSGMLAIVPEDEVSETDMTVEDAMKIVFSGGIVLPDMMRPENPVMLPRVRQDRPGRTEEHERRMG